MRKIAFHASWLAVATIISTAAPAAAQSKAATSSESQADGDIIVTARKREETSISVPVVITAVGQKELERRAVNSLDGVARLVPQLVVGEAGGSIQGGNIALRGVAGADTNPFGDQAVSFNIDGVQVARASIRRLATMDMAQVEVLKGPQALFFGKNSPAGIISIRTADPTPNFEAKVMGGYEFVGHEWRGEGYVSGPITDTLGVRVAAYGSDLRGYVRNIVPKTELLAPAYNHVPYNEEYAVRGTLKFEPSDRFDARLKVNYSHSNASGTSQNAQYISCPRGFPSGAPNDECKADNHVSAGIVGTSFTPFDPVFGDGVPYSRQRQTLAGLEMNYHLSDQLTITSVTGYYKLKARIMENYFYSPNPSFALPSVSPISIREISQEVRLTSDFDGPFNFMTGGHYQDSRAATGSTTYLNALNPSFVNNYYLVQDGKAWSVFGQAMVDIVDTLQLSVGGRYSNEKKNLPLVERSLSAGVPRAPITPFIDHGSWHNFSPEFTLNWRPTDRLTVFGSYKKGFLSGGFNSGNTNFASNTKYDQQTIAGFEGGVKASLLDGKLRTNLSIYRYVVRGLQVSTNPAPTIQVITNAGKLHTEGAEFDFSYSAPVEGLSFHGALAYNKARYDIFSTPCYRGQVAATGCSEGLPNAIGRYTLTNLKGRQVVRAPDWSGNVGFNFEQPIGALKIGLSSDVTYSASYYAHPSDLPAGRQPSYALLDANIRLGSQDDQWEVALIGRNLTDKYYFTRAIENTFTGTAIGSATPTPADVVGIMGRGREIMLRFSYKIGG